MGYNDYNGKKPVAEYKADIDGIIRGIRAAQPKTPIYLITPLWSTEPAGPRLEDYRKAVREVAAAMKGATHVVGHALGFESNNRERIAVNMKCDRAVEREVLGPE